MTFCIAFKFAQICDKTGNSGTPWQIFCHSLHFIKTEEAVELAMSPPTSNSVNNPFLFIFILHLAQSCFFFCCLLFGNWKTCLHLQGMVTGDSADIQKLMGENCVRICDLLVISYMGKRLESSASIFFFTSDKPKIQTVSKFSHLLSQCETMIWIGYLYTDFSKFFPIKSICKSVHPGMLKAVCLSPCRKACDHSGSQYKIYSLVSLGFQNPFREITLNKLAFLLASVPASIKWG